MSVTVAQPTETLSALLALGQSADVARFIHVASAALLQGVNHDGLRLLLVRRLVEQGLLRRAAAIAEGLSPEVRSHPEFGPLLRSLGAGTADGYVPWNQWPDRFAANLAALRQRYAWADQAAAVWDAEGTHLELHVTKDGHWQVFDRRPGPAGGWRPAFGHHVPQPAAEKFATRFKGHLLAPLVIEGVGLGFHLPWAYAATADTFLGASAPIYQIEPSWLALAVALHLNDWRELLADPRVTLCCGPNAYDEFERLIATTQGSFPPQLVIGAVSWDGRVMGEAQKRVEAVTQRLEASHVALRAAVSAAYRGRDRAWWHARYAAALRGAGPPLRVLGVTSRFTTVLQYAMRDLLGALQAGGSETRLLIELDNHSRISPHQQLATIQNFQPDLVLLIDRTRHGQQAGLIDDVPVLTWVQDRLPWLFDQKTGAALGPLDFCMGVFAPELIDRYGYPAERFFYCRMATDPTRLQADDEPAYAADDAVLECDLAFATNHDLTPAEFYEDFRRRQDPRLAPLLAAIYEELAALSDRTALDGGLCCEPFVARLEAAVGIELTAEGRALLAARCAYPLADRLLRHQTIAWAARWAETTGRQLHLYGRGWEAHPQFSRYARGFVEHGPRLGQVFRAAKVNLHAGCACAFHQRVLDILSAGGFVLIRRHSDDTGFHVSEAIYAHARARGLRPGLKVRCHDLPPPLGDELAALLRRRGLDPSAPLELTAAQVYHLECAFGTKSIPVVGREWPQLERVTFGTEAEFAERMEWFLAHQDERRAIARDMRTRAVDSFSYPALVKKLLPWLTQALRPPK